LCLFCDGVVVEFDRFSLGSSLRASSRSSVSSWQTDVHVEGGRFFFCTARGVTGRGGAGGVREEGRGPAEAAIGRGDDEKLLVRDRGEEESTGSGRERAVDRRGKTAAGAKEEEEGEREEEEEEPPVKTVPL
jgi:hypothetical protein